MGYKIDSESFNGIVVDVGKNKDKWLSNLNNTINKLRAIEKLPNFQGSTADSIINYIEKIHVKAIGDNLKNLLMLHSGNIALFYGEYGNIESNNMAIISQEEILDIKKTEEKNKKRTESLDLEIGSILKSISSIVTLGATNKDRDKDVTEAQTYLIKYVSNVDTAILNLDSTHEKADFNETAKLIESLKNLIKECASQKREFIENFSDKSIGLLNSYNMVVNSGSLVEKQYSQNSVKIKEAEKNAVTIKKDIADYKEREKKAKRIKFAVAVGCAVISTVVVVATAGMGTGAAIAICAASGAVTSAAATYADERTSLYVEKGNWDMTDEEKKNMYKNVATSAVVGGVTGAVTGAFSAGGDFHTYAIKEGVKKTLIKGGLAVGEEVCKGTMERGIKSTVTGIGEVVEGKTDIKSAILNAGADTFDKKELGKDVVNGTTSFVIGEAADGVSEKIGLDKMTSHKNKNAISRTISNAGKSSAEKVVEGGVSRFTDDIIDGKSLKEAAGDAVDGYEIAKDATKGATSGGIKGLGKTKTHKDEVKHHRQWGMEKTHKIVAERKAHQKQVYETKCKNLEKAREAKARKREAEKAAAN